MSETVVVGIDDSEHSVRAVDRAVGEAEARRATFHLVNAYHRVPPAPFGLPPGLVLEDTAHTASLALVDEAAARVRRAHPGLLVTAASVNGDAAGALVDASRDAALLVVGGRGRGGFVGQLLGSVVLRVLDRAECPVMVMRGDPLPSVGRIMVGLDLDDPHSGPDVLEFAFTEAALRDAGVHAVHVWDDTAWLHLAGGRHLNEVIAAIAANRCRDLESLLEPWREKFPDVTASSQAFPGSAGRRLVDSTLLVDLLVIGGRVRTRGHTGMRIGALARTVLNHAHCPVVIVPEHRAERKGP
jgi:nucleotide-binding universal stress UspA family protein